MQINITARHLEIGPDIRSYMNDKLGRLTKYSDKIEEAKAIFQKEKFNHIAEIALTGKGFHIIAVERDHDLRASFDLCLANAQKQLKKSREKFKRRKVKNFFESFRRFKRNQDKLISPSRHIVKVESFGIKPMSPEEAALELEAFNREFIVFHNAVDNNINVLYKRKNGDYGLIEP
jgi:putative sigma-54 modulation protein